MSDSHESRHIDPRIKAIMRWQFKFIFINFFVALFAGWAIGQLLVDPAAHPVWFGLTSGALATIFIRVFNYTSLVLLQFWYYRLDVSSLVSDSENAMHVMNGTSPPPIESDPKAQVHEFRVTKKARKPLGRYMDHDFYEWIEIARGEARERLYFDGTIDLKKATVKDIPGDCLILPPGIIYRAQQ
mgnify:CR=1 FL=1